MSTARVTAWRATVGADDAGSGRVAETTHPVHVAICTPDGALVAHAGDPDLLTPLRSCLKPIQAQALFMSGAAERFAITPAELALACASHDGAPLHLETVRGLLDRLGLGVDDLMCGAHRPTDPDGVAALGAAPPTPLHNNCSGKHAAMLASALALGAPTRDYLQARHPVQALIRQAIAALVPEGATRFSVDGCSAPTPVMSLRAIALMFARFADPSGVPALAPGLAATYSAMRAHPELVGGRGVIDTRLMRSLEGIAAKRGADGGYAIAVPATSDHPALGIALKVESGDELARAPAVLAVLEQLELMTPAARFALRDLARPERRNHRGLVVGAWEATLTLGRQ